MGPKQSRRQTAIGGLAALLVMTAVGCAVTQHEVSLDLMSQVETYPTAQVRSTPIQVSVLDDRESELVGQRGAVGAKIKAPSLMSEVEAAINAVFTRKGYRLTSGQQAEAKVKVRLRGTRFDYTTGFWTGGQHVSAVISLTASKDGDAGEYEKTYRSSAERRRFVVAFGEEIDQLFNRHLTETIRQIANDEALHRFLTE